VRARNGVEVVQKVSSTIRANWRAAKNQPFLNLNLVEMTFPPASADHKWRAGRPTFWTTSQVRALSWIPASAGMTPVPFVMPAEAGPPQRRNDILGFLSILLSRYSPCLARSETRLELKHTPPAALETVLLLRSERAQLTALPSEQSEIF